MRPPSSRRRRVNLEEHALAQELGERIRAARIRRHMSQTEVATKVGISYQQFQKYEVARNRVSAGALVSIARALCVQVDWLLGLDEKPIATAPLPALDPVDAYLLAAARRLNPEHRRALTAFLHTLGNTLELKTSREAA